MNRRSRQAAATGMRSLSPHQRTLPALLELQATAHGDRPLLEIDGLRRTYAEVADAAARVAGTLEAAAIGRGDRVAVLCNNRREALDFFLGCAWLGAVVVPINTAARGVQLEHMLTNSRARLLVIEAALVPALGMISKPDLLERVWLLEQLPAEAPADYPFEPMPPLGEPVPAAPVGPQDTLGILYTSGTTGVSKGVCCPHGQFYWWGILMGEHLEITADDILFTCLPLFHTNALNAFMQALMAGAQYKVASRFSASRFWSQVTEAEATVTYVLGAMVGILCNQPESADDRSHVIRIALGPGVPVGFHEEFRRRFGVLLSEGYGSTELNVVIGAPPDQQRPGWMGRVLPEFEAIVADELDEPVADGTAGDLLVRPREPFSISTGYFGMPEATTDAWRNLWFHTGDRVVRAPDGWFRFLDRSKDAIRRRGENISSFEVEEAVISHGAVKTAAAFPVPSEFGEDEVMVAVVCENDVELDPVDLIRHCEPRLAYFAIPRFVDIVGELPLTENGKVRKAVLRERGVTESTWDREAAGYRLSRLPR